jgi:hypothetical protein
MDTKNREPVSPLPGGYYGAPGIRRRTLSAEILTQTVRRANPLFSAFTNSLRDYERGLILSRQLSRLKGKNHLKSSMFLTRSSAMENQESQNHQHNIEISYRKIFSRLNTRKKFAIQSIEGPKVTVEQDEEICGQKEPRIFEFNSEKELEQFVTEENQFERDINSQLSGDSMPYR